MIETKRRIQGTKGVREKSTDRVERATKPRPFHNTFILQKTLRTISDIWSINNS